MPFDLPVNVSGFGPSFNAVPNSSRIEKFSTSEIIGAAITAGHGYTSGTPRIDWRIRAWRVAAIRLALDLPPATLPGVNSRLSHPRAWAKLDPSEKAAVNNLLGNTVTKLLCQRLLDAPRLWFLDVYRSQFSSGLVGSKRPDFFTQTRSGAWLSLEAKGRSYAPSTQRLVSAKTQAQALTSINGTPTKAHIVCWTMARNGCVAARFHDPKPEDEHTGGMLKVDLEQLVHDYYAPVQEIMEASEPVEYPHRLKLFRFEAADFLIGLHPRLQHLLSSESANVGAKLAHIEHGLYEPVGNITCDPDGVIVVPGRSWPT
jgi:hypothetical protein